MSKKPPPNWVIVERLLIIVTSLGLAVYITIDAVNNDKLDYLSALGLLFAVIGYFAKDLTGQSGRDDDR